jgi:hypothetical protein
MGGGSPLEGGEALGLSASLWGEQVRIYVGWAHRANRHCIPGVSRPSCRGIPPFCRLRRVIGPRRGRWLSRRPPGRNIVPP